MSYDFRTLSPEDFEHLCRDLLSAEWKIQLEAFKSGRDSGIDLRYSQPERATSKTIVQCKRYSPGNLAQLKQALKGEVTKLEKLKPDRYVLATSVGLTPSNKDDVLDILKPWCKNSGDILGPDELNGLLNRHGDIEKAHFKLWISSTASLERILAAGIFNITEDTLLALREQVSKLVVHAGFKKALDSLHLEHHVLILGNPGIGKTTLARMLMAHYVQEGFQPIVVIGNISDAWKLTTAALKDHGKAIVFYDDFLGQVRFDEGKFEKNEEKSLVQFLARVRKSPNLRFILTTREYVLADAERIHGAFSTHVKEISKYTISLADYADSQRARILFNHLYFSDLPETRLKAFAKHKTYRKIIAHRYFNPRIVEGISTWANSKSLTDEEYLRYVETEFNDPAKVWEHPFTNQISPTSRQMLIVLWSFGGSVPIPLLEEALMAFNTGHRPEEVLLKIRFSLKELDGNFIKTDRHQRLHEPSEHHLIVKFQNPSVEEFIEKFVNDNPIWLRETVRNAVRFSQIEHLLHWAGTGWGEHQPKRKELDQATWSDIYEALKRVGQATTGHLVNYAGFSKPLFDLNDAISKPERALVVITIAQNANVNDTYLSKLSELLDADAGWQEFLAGVPDSDSVAFDIRRLITWILNSTEWVDKQKEACFRAFQQALLAFLHDEDTWSTSVDALVVLAQSLDLIAGGISDDHKAAFKYALGESINTALDNYDDPDHLDSEGSAVLALSKILKVNYESSAGRLFEKANERRESPKSGKVNPDKWTYKSNEQEDVDIDALFSSLGDR